MKFSSSLIEDIKSRLPIATEIGKTVTLKKSGYNKYTGLCPFHKEKTPSFTVDNNKGFYHCFGCGASGDIISFIMQNKNMHFADTIEYLAHTAGVIIPKQATNNKEQNQQEQEKLSLYDIMEQACQFFQQNLTSKTGSSAREYLQKRNVREEEIAIFKLGFATANFHELHHHMKKKGITEKQLLACGLLIKNEKNDIYDRFRNRIIFPIEDSKGRIIAFGGRSLGDDMPKYLNSPETIIFKKSQILYNIKNAQKHTKDSNIIVVEGYMDVIALHKAGIKNVVAPLGTALTEEHIRKIWTLCPEPTLCFDGDKAGITAMQRAAIMSLSLLHPGFSINFCLLPVNLDPADLVELKGKQETINILSKTKPLSEIIWSTELAKKDISTPERKAELEKRLISLTEEIKDRNIKSHYRKFFFDRIKEEFFPRKNQYTPAKVNTKQQAKNNKNSGTATSIINLDSLIPIDVNSQEGCETLILAIILHHPYLLGFYDIEEEIINMPIINKQLNKIRDLFINANVPTSSQHLSTQNESITDNFLIVLLEKNGYGTYIEYLAKAKNAILPDTSEANKEELRNCWDYIMALYNLVRLKIERNELIAQMNEEAEAKAIELNKHIAIQERKIRLFDMSVSNVAVQSHYEKNNNVAS